MTTRNRQKKSYTHIIPTPHVDYTYIIQLIDRYFDGETSLAEEQMLRLFFSQPLADDVPQQVRQWDALFRLADADREDMRLPDDFEQRIIAATEGADTPGEKHPARVKAVTISLSERLKPLMRAAAAVAVLLTIGNAMRFTMQQAQPQTDDINYADYHDTYTDPNAAYQQASQALRLITEGLAQAQQDSIDIQP